MFPRYDLIFCACTRAWLAPEILVSMGSSPHLWFLHAKQRVLDPNNESLWVPDLTCGFVHAKQRDLHQNDKPIWVPALTCVFFFMQNSDFKTRLTSLYWSHTSSVVLSTHKSVISTRLKRMNGFQLAPVVLCLRISDFSTWITSLYWSLPSSVVFTCKTAIFGPAYKCLWVPDLTCRFVCTKLRD